MKDFVPIRLAIAMTLMISLVAGSAGCPRAQDGDTSKTTDRGRTTTQKTATTIKEPEPRPESTSEVGLVDFGITMDRAKLKSGPIRFHVANDGKVVHELVVLRTGIAAERLPVKGGLVDEDAKGIRTMGEIEDVKPGETKSFELNLEPGSYVGICNITGHYQLGMRIGFKVE